MNNRIDASLLDCFLVPALLILIPGPISNYGGIPVFLVIHLLAGLAGMALGIRLFIRFRRYQEHRKWLKGSYMLFALLSVIGGAFILFYALIIFLLWFSNQ